MKVVSKALRDSARGETCTLRLDGCLFQSDTVVLAHLPCGQKGIGMKGPDQVSAYLCMSCHSAVDGASRWEIHARDYLRALAETQGRMIQKGLIVIKGIKQ